RIERGNSCINNKRFNGSVRYEDKRSKTVWSLSKLNSSLSMDSRISPIAMDARFTLNDEAFVVDATITSLDSYMKTQAVAVVGTVDSGVMTAKLNGVYNANALRYEGGIDVSSSSLKRLATWVDPKSSINTAA